MVKPTLQEPRGINQLEIAFLIVILLLTCILCFFCLVNYRKTNMGSGMKKVKNQGYEFSGEIKPLEDPRDVKDENEVVAMPMPFNKKKFSVLTQKSPENKKNVLVMPIQQTKESKIQIKPNRKDVLPIQQIKPSEFAEEMPSIDTKELKEVIVIPQIIFKDSKNTIECEYAGNQAEYEQKYHFNIIEGPDEHEKHHNSPVKNEEKHPSIFQGADLPDRENFLGADLEK